ncbi:Predicted N-acetyltransferase YhbS [Halogranum gelatinilyticum]|uniref:Predicted N-acetyltransferase YhbS n=1 Tax=Halogranum gelatinilyticum TaxID=660521 RepID=A0A1G9PJ14_9EURY|nr:GNAT family N-acetyltransferase [Halogranum gelatinilyticum]SDL98543.1 Predicted N-acetyltransferase YhbS [Halogranum gelatinilyticum]
MAEGRETVRIRAATADDLVAVMRLFDAAVLEADAGEVGDRISDGSVLVADADGRVVGALALDGSHVDAVAVQKERRGRGIGRRLVEAAADAVDGALTADFDDSVRPFYDALGFEVERRDGRLWGRL